MIPKLTVSAIKTLLLNDENPSDTAGIEKT